MKKILSVLACVLLFGCGSRVERSTVATVIDVYQEPSTWGCVGTNWNTVVKLDDLSVTKLCGKFGKPGDSIRGCWYVDSTDPLSQSRSGWTTYCKDVPIRGAKP